MKKIIVLLMAMICVATFSMSAFAEDGIAQPRIAQNCPNCGRGGLVERKLGERQEAEYDTCCHGLKGFDKYLVTYNVMCVKCSANCGYSEPSYEVRIGRTLVDCGGVL